jgi:hypothetical protein
MKNLKQLALLLVVFGGFAASAATPVEVLIPVDDVYSPKGFDSNDNTEVVVTGYLPNLCHKAPKTVVKVMGKKIDIKLKSLKYDPTNPFCPEVIVPFVETVDVGVLDKGNYDIVVNGQSMYQKTSNILISEATSDAIDDFIYAGVEYVDKSYDDRRIVLKGYNPSDCFVLDSIQVADNEKNVYSVLPRMKQVSDLCAMKMVPFNYEMELPNNLKADKVLIHVRSMNGKSVNSIYYNTPEL